MRNYSYVKYLYLRSLYTNTIWNNFSMNSQWPLYKSVGRTWREQEVHKANPKIPRQHIDANYHIKPISLLNLFDASSS